MNVQITVLERVANIQFKFTFVLLLLCVCKKIANPKISISVNVRNQLFSN